jgi:DNA invertase Pin-like site-specific DNA recombinase
MRAIGIARQSHGDGASVEEQAARIRENAKREGWNLVDVLPEQDVSGGRALDKRPGLLAAVEAVEAGRAEIIVVAYFDRLVRSLRVQGEVVERVEAAGGRIMTLDVGEVSSATAASWLSASFLGTVAEYHRRATSERVKAAHAQRRAKGQWNGGRIPFYREIDADGVVTFRKGMEPVVREAFELRASGRSVADVLAVLRERTGLPLRSLNIAQRMLRDETLVGVAVTRSTFELCQNLVTKRGARPKSDRLLARLGVLRCHECGGSMNVHGSAGSTQVYRCHRGCGVAISVQLAEDTVAHAARCALKGFRGGAGGSLESLEEVVRAKSAALDRLVMILDGFDDVEAARSKLSVATGELKEAQAELDDARAAAGFTMSPSLDWSMLSLDAKRELVRCVVSAATVSPGRGETRQYFDPATGDKMKLSSRVEIELHSTFQPDAILDSAARTMRDDLEDARAEWNERPKFRAA